MEEIKLNMENLTKEERDQLLKLVEKANKQEPRVWKPELKEVYYYFSSEGYTEQASWHDCQGDEDSYAIGNCFKTKKEVEFALERQKVIVELERFAKENNYKSNQPAWYLVYHNSVDAVIWVQIEKSCPKQPTSLLFSDNMIAAQAIEIIGEDRLKKYYFGIKE